MIEGRGPAPSFVVALVQGLPQESLTVALASGGRHLFGYSGMQSRLDDIFDAVNVNTQATGNWKNGKPPQLPLAPRPTAPTPATEPKGKAKVKDLFKRLGGSAGRH